MAEKELSFDEFFETMQRIAADGVSFKDFQNGIFCKRTIVVEDDNLLRENIIKRFKGSALFTFCAQDYKTAKRLIYPRFQNVSKFMYAIIDDKFPEQRGDEPKCLADIVADELLKEHPGIRIFGYFENNSNVDRSKYIDILKKDIVALDDLYKIMIKDSETIREEKCQK